VIDETTVRCLSCGRSIAELSPGVQFGLGEHGTAWLRDPNVPPGGGDLLAFPFEDWINYWATTGGFHPVAVPGVGPWSDDDVRQWAIATMGPAGERFRRGRCGFIRSVPVGVSA
jgi:hypothetical protein